MELLIDGLYLLEPATGVQRFAVEVLERLSRYEDLKLTIVLPIGSEIKNKLPSNGNVDIVYYGKKIDENARFWELLTLGKYAKKRKLPLLCMANISPRYKNSYVVIHDLRVKEKEIKQKTLFRLEMSLLTRYFIYCCKKVVTVSNFSKDRMLHFYPKLKRINKEPLVACNGYEHVYDIKEEAVDGVDGDFYFTVGSLYKYKNFKYVVELAMKNPNKQFVIAGGVVEKLSQNEIEKERLSNCKFVGYINDGQLKWLYSHCKGYILPSLYEGFGLPPLEALACGCKNIYLSEIEVFKEIYSGVATFFNPKDYVNTVKLDDCNIKQEDIERVLNKYTWDNAADIIYKKIKEDFEN